MVMCNHSAAPHDHDVKAGELRLLLAETFAHDAFNALACHGGAGNFAGNG